MIKAEKFINKIKNLHAYLINQHLTCLCLLNVMYLWIIKMHFELFPLIICIVQIMSTRWRTSLFRTVGPVDSGNNMVEKININWGHSMTQLGMLCVYIPLAYTSAKCFKYI